MFGIGAPWAFLFEHPLVGLIVFFAVSAAVIMALSGGKLAESIGGIFRIFITIFTTPFIFLRDALAMMRSSGDDEQDYVQSSVFMLFRANRIQYMALLVLCLLTLGGGITTAVILLYPQAEMTASKLWSDQIAETEREVATAQQNVNAASTPAYAATLNTRRQQAQEAYQAQVQGNQNFMRASTFTGPAIDILRSAQSSDATTRVRENIDYYMTGCPRGWTNMTFEMCGQYRAFLLELANRRDREFNLGNVAAQADANWRQAANAAEQAAAQLADAQQRLENARNQLAAVSPWGPGRMAQRIIAAGLIVLGTLWSVVVIVWIGATMIDFFNWIVLMMRSLEKTQSDRLIAARKPEIGSAG
jgi:hypothetical protein